MLNEQSYTDPYDKLPKKDKLTTSITTAREDHAFLFSLFPNRSVVQTTLNILLARLVEELKANGFKHYDPERYQHSIARCRIDLNGGASSGPSAQAPEGHDGGGVAGVGGKDEGLPDQLPKPDGRSEGVKRKAKRKEK